MQIGKLAALAATMVLATALFSGRAEAQQKDARIRVSVTVVSNPLPPAMANRLVATADPATPQRLLPVGVRIVVSEPGAMPIEAGRPADASAHTRKVVIEYVGT